MSKELIFLKPAFSHNIWGGSRLREEFGYDEPGDDIGECWGISAYPGKDNEIKNGEFAGVHLSELWDKRRDLFGNAEGDVFPLLVKIITAKDSLSVQVHPDDEYARTHENGSLGKMECWYILDAEPGSEIIIGHNAASEDELRAMIESDRWNDLIRRVQVKPGDFVQIDPGTVHAICGGITLLEAQQSSDITYRMYDYGRTLGGKPRELHIRQSLDCVTVPSPEIKDMLFHDSSDEDVSKLITSSYYEVYRISCCDELNVEFDKPFILMSVIDGEGTADGIQVRKGDHFIVPAGFGTLSVKGTLRLIATCLP